MAPRTTGSSSGGRAPAPKGGAPTATTLGVGEVAAIVEGVLGSMEGDLTFADIKLYRELESLARYIDGAKAEIAALSPDEISSTHIPKATDELDAIIEATEEATNTIMSAAEKIQSVEVEGAAADALTEAVTAIYEACSFQDITGQRITKVVKTLKHIDEKVAALVAAFGEEIRKYKQSSPLAPEAKPVKALTEQDVLHGPQRAADARTQAEIDALLAGTD